MHKSAAQLARLAFEIYLPPGGSVLDVGSMNVNGTLRDCLPSGAKYVGLDIAQGPGVDMVMPIGGPIPFQGSFDMAVSSSTLEHDPLFWLTFLEMFRVVREGGHVYINVPSNGPHHAHPVDCWRFYGDAGAALHHWARRSGFDVVLMESFIAPRMGDEWEDNVMVFRKDTYARGSTRRIWHGLAGAKHISTTVNI